MFFVKKNNENRLKSKNDSVDSLFTTVTASVWCEELTDEEVRQSIYRMHDTMKSYRNRAEQDRRDAQKLAQEIKSR